jgi:MFS family permease
MSVATFNSAQRTRSLVAVIAAALSVGIAVGAIVPLISLRLEAQGYSRTLIGINGAMFPIGLLVIGNWLPQILRFFGPLRAVYFGVAVTAVSILLLPVLDNYFAWSVLRLGAGAAGGVYWVMSETWINMMVTDKTRGRVMALYTAAMAFGFAVGPEIVARIGIDGFLPFAIVAAMMALSAVPFFFVHDVKPEIPEHAGVNVLGAVRIAPIVIFAGLAGGAAESALYVLLPLYGTDSGYDSANAARLLTWFYIGNVVLQFPLGAIADRYGRFRLLQVCIAGTLVGAILFPLLFGHLLPLRAMLLLWGGVTMGIYTLSLSLLGERFKPGDLSAANAAYVMMYEFGGLGGPVLAGGMMDTMGRQGLPLFAAFTAAAYLVYAAVARRKAARGERD